MLFEKLKSHDSKFFSNFRMSVSTFEFLVMRLSDHIKGQDTAMRACVHLKEMLAMKIRWVKIINKFFKIVISILKIIII